MVPCMSEPSGPRPSRAQLREQRTRTIDRLSQSFADDLLDIDEFEDRIDRAHQAGDRETLAALLADLDGPGQSLAVAGEQAVEKSDAAATGQELAMPPADPGDTATVVAIFGGAERKGQWRVPGTLRCLSIFGGTEIDLREAIIPPGTHEIRVFTMFGAVEIIVPPWIAVECDGGAILGAFESANRASQDPDPDAPLVRIRGLSVFGAARVSTRLPGESERQAKKRHKRALKARKKAQLERARRAQLPE